VGWVVGREYPLPIGGESGEEMFFIFSSVNDAIWCISSVELRRYFTVKQAVREAATYAPPPAS